MGPLVVGLAAGALGFVLGSLGKNGKKEEPAKQPKPDPRIDQLMQNQQRMEGMLGRILKNQQTLMGGQAALFGQGLAHQLFQNPAMMFPMFGGCQDPGQFLGQLGCVTHCLARHC